MDMCIVVSLMLQNTSLGSILSVTIQALSGTRARSKFICIGGIFGRDGCIYSLSYEHTNVLKFDVVNNTYSRPSWETTAAYIGHHRTLKFDTETQIISLEERFWRFGV